MSDQPLRPGRHGNPRLLSVRVSSAGEAKNYLTGAQRVTTVPLSIVRKRRRTLMVPPPGASSVMSETQEDWSMIRTLGKAFYWQKLLDQGRYGSIRELADALKLDLGWVAEVLRLTLLAPDIIERIVEGRQPRQLDLQALRGRLESVPRDWHAQRVLFGLSA